MLTETERREFFFQAIECFLLNPQQHYSQLAVVKGLTEFDISLHDLMSYVAAKIGLDLPQDEFFKAMNVQADAVTNPIALLPAILTLL